MLHGHPADLAVQEDILSIVVPRSPPQALRSTPTVTCRWGSHAWHTVMVQATVTHGVPVGSAICHGQHQGESQAWGCCAGQAACCSDVWLVVCQPALLRPYLPHQHHQVEKQHLLLLQQKRELSQALSWLHLLLLSAAFAHKYTPRWRTHGRCAICCSHCHQGLRF
jgi:hypothetical protein